MKFGWLGFHTEGLDAATVLLRNGHQLEAVITLEDKEASKRSGVGDYSGLCSEFSVPLHRIRSVNDPESVELLRELDLDVLFVIGWSQIVKPEALSSVRIGMIGAHASPLPHNRGSAPVNWAIIRGETVGGNSLIWLSEGVDEGDLIDVRKFEITQYDTCRSVYEKVAASTAAMLSALLPKLEAGETPGQRQEPTTQPVLPRRRPTDGAIDWDTPGRGVYDFIRALTKPYPGAYSWLDGDRYLIWESAFVPIEVDTGLANGAVIAPVISPVDHACGQAISVAGGILTILEVEDSDGTTFKGRHLADLDWQGGLWSNGEK